MNKYRIDIERSMRTTIDVTAISEESARHTALEIAKQKSICEYQNYGHSVKYVSRPMLTAKEKARMKREELRAFMKHYLHDGCDKQELSDIAFRGMSPNWFDYVKRENEPWQESFFAGIASGDDPKSDLYYRYARLAARWRFRSYYGGYNGFSRDLAGSSKEQRKQAVLEALTELRRQWQERTGSDEDCRLDYQAVLRYNGEDETDYWNVFVYPLVQGGYEYCWQHCMDDGDDTDDYGCIECKSREELLKRLFYREDCDTTDDDPDWQALSHIWVD